MGWSDRQTAMLAEMGIRVWSPGEPEPEQVPVADADPVIEPITEPVNELHRFDPPSADARAPTPPGSVDARQLDWPTFFTTDRKSVVQQHSLRQIGRAS